MNERVARQVGVGIAVLYALILCGLSIIRYRNGWGFTFDMGVYQNDLWLLAHGHAHSQILNRNLFSDHTTLVLLPLALLYRFFPFGETLLVVQSFAVASSVFPAMRIAAHFGISRSMAASAVLLSAPLFSAAMFDFHPSTIAVPFMFWAIVGMLEQRRRLLIAGSIAVLICRADLVVFIAALFAVGPVRQMRVFVPLVCAGLLLAVLPSVLVPQDNFASFYGNLGATPADVVSHPARLLENVFNARSSWIVFIWLVPVGFLAVAAWRWMGAALITGLPILLVGLEGPIRPWLQYGAIVTPLLMTGAFSVIARARRKDQLWFRSSIAMLFVCSVLSMLFFSPFSSSAQAPNNSATFTTGRGVNISQLSDAVESDVPVAADSHLLTYLANRRDVYPFPLPFARNKEVAGRQPSAIEGGRIEQVVVAPAQRSSAAAYGFVQVLEQGEGFLVLSRDPGKRRPATFLAQ